MFRGIVICLGGLMAGALAAALVFTPLYRLVVGLPIGRDYLVRTSGLVWFTGWSFGGLPMGVATYLAVRAGGGHLVWLGASLVAGLATAGALVLFGEPEARHIPGFLLVGACAGLVAGAVAFLLAQLLSAGP